MLVLMGATPEGKKELIGFQTGMRGERAKAGRSCSVDLKARGLSRSRRKVAIGDGALGILEGPRRGVPDDASSAMLAAQRHWQRAFDKLPKSMQPNVHKDLREIWLSPEPGRGGKRR